MKEEGKNLGRSLTSIFLGPFSAELKIMAIKVLTELGRRMDGHSEDFHKETEERNKYPIKVTELDRLGGSAG